MNVNERVQKLEALEIDVENVFNRASELGISVDGVSGLRAHVQRDLDIAYAQRAREARKAAFAQEKRK